MTDFLLYITDFFLYLTLKGENKRINPQRQDRRKTIEDFCLFDASGMKVSLFNIEQIYLVRHIFVIVTKEEKCRISLQNYMYTFCTVIHKFAEKHWFLF